ncbi:hypothetical protein OIU79_001850 [Salix purpurea]|uniref:Uncharacterized protein n=1 Tax=Salix purpurea TaxID=77065 RepID=A0A9Q0URC4_SALPP|nr:hypothetical protein OIU79_001850 [Salix purpurea]
MNKQVLNGTCFSRLLLFLFLASGIKSIRCWSAKNIEFLLLLDCQEPVIKCGRCWLMVI